ncbi:MAG TPA: hypothetical protein VNO21_06810, partial [Polyangiaceae bacterium]|nr:hypothetical protein [Polyangiaceae bacterium]
RLDISSARPPRAPARTRKQGSTHLRGCGDVGHARGLPTGTRDGKPGRAYLAVPDEFSVADVTKALAAAE